MSAMVVVWGVTYLLHSTLLIGLVWLAARWIHSASAKAEMSPLQWTQASSQVKEYFPSGPPPSVSSIR